MKVGLAGFGFAIRHAQVVAANPFVTEFAIAELSADRREQAAQEHPQARIFNEAVEMLQRMEPDCVIVASSSDSHAPPSPGPPSRPASTSSPRSRWPCPGPRPGI